MNRHELASSCIVVGNEQPKLNDNQCQCSGSCNCNSVKGHGKIIKWNKNKIKRWENCG